MQFSPGQSARNSTTPTNQPWSNQLLLVIFASCCQGFDLKYVVIEAFRRKTIETWIHLNIHSILWHP